MFNSRLHISSWLSIRPYSSLHCTNRRQYTPSILTLHEDHPYISDLFSRRRPWSTFVPTLPPLFQYHHSITMRPEAMLSCHGDILFSSSVLTFYHFFTAPSICKNPTPYDLTLSDHIVSPRHSPQQLRYTRSLRTQARQSCYNFYIQFQ